LKPFLREETLFGYRLDVSTLEEINYYFDRVVPNLKGRDSLSALFRGKEGRLVLMPKKVYDDIQSRGNPPLVLIQEFQYKKGQLVLLSS
jgi:hypothetical protein